MQADPLPGRDPGQRYADHGPAPRDQGRRGLYQTRPRIRPQHRCAVSIAAGIPIKTIEKVTGNARCIRVMPNMALQIGEGAAGYSLGTRNENQDALIVETVFGSLGKVFQFPEHLLDAVTGLSGTGPAYVFIFIEALADGGVLAGLPRREALILSAQTVMGAAKLLLEND